MLDDLQILVQAVINEVASRLGMQQSLKTIGSKLTVPVTAKLNKTASRQQIKTDLNALQKLYVNIGAKLNRSEARKQLRSDIKTLGNEKVRLHAEVDTAALKRDLSGASSVKNPTVDIDTGSGAENLNKVADGIDRVNRKSTATIASVTLLHQTIIALERAAKKMVSTAVELDSKLTDLRMATGDSYESARQLVDTYNELALELGATTSEVVSAADAWLRQGHSVTDTNKLIADAMILSKVSQLDSAAATEYLTSAMKGYKIAASEVIGVVDKLTAVDLVSATDAGGLAEAMSRTAVTADMAGISMDRLLGYLATVGEVTQKSMSSIGESFKTIFTRMSDIKENKLELIDEDGTTETLSNVELTLKKVGINLRETVTEYRDYGDVLDNLAAKWGTLSEVQQNALAKAFAGTRQAENFRVLMENYASAMEYMDVASNSTGTATQKFMAYQESLESKLNSLTAAFEALAMDTLDNEFLGALIDAGTAILQFVDNLNLLQIALVALGTAGVVKGFSFIAERAINAYNSVAKLTTAFNMLHSISSANISTEQFARLKTVCEGLNTSQMRLIITNQALTNEQRTALLMASGLTAEEAAQTLATMGLATAQAGATAATFSFAGAISALTAAFAANPIGFILVGLTTAITIIKTVVDHVKQAREELNQTISDLTSEIQNLQKSSANVKELSARYEELASKTELSAEEQAEFVSIQNKLKELLPEVNGYYDEQGNFVLAQGESLDSLTQTYRDYLSLKRQELADAYAQKVKEQTREYVNQQAEIEKLNDLLTLQQLLKNGEGFKSFSSDRESYESYKSAYGDNAASVYYSDLASMYGADMIANQKQLNELQSENKVILDELRDGTINLISAQDEWYELAENQQNGIRNIVSQMGFDEAKVLYNEVSADGADYDAILQQLLVDHADMIPVMNDTATAAESISTALSDAKDQVSDMSKTIDKLSSSYDLLATAMQEMAEGRGLSADTIKSLADAEENYIDFLYEENGVIKLNTAAWEARSRSLVDADTAAIEAEITALESERKAIQDVIDNYAEKRRAALGSQDLVSYQYYCELIDGESAKLEKANASLAEKERLLRMVKTAYDSIRPTDWDNTFSAFDTAVDQLKTLANLKDTVASGYTVTAEKAREFAEVYPEILEAAQTTANGEIALNDAVVNAFLQGKQEEIKSSVDAEVKKLNAKKAVLQAELDIVNAQIAAALNGDEQEVKSANEAAAAQMAIEQAVLSACEQAGIDEATANQLALAAMTGDWDAFTTLAQNAVYDLDDESASAFTSVMQNYAAMSKNMVDNTNQVIQAFSRMGEALQNAMNGKTTATFSANISGNTVSGSGKEAISGLTAEMFESAKSSYTSGESGTFENSLKQWQERLQSVADSYTSTGADLDSLYAQQSTLNEQMGAIDRQVGLLQSIYNAPLKTFSSTKSSGGNGKFKTPAEALEDQVKELESKLQEFIGDYEHSIFLLEKNDGTPEQIIAIYRKMQEAVHAQAEQYRAMGLDENSDYIQSLQKQWWSYQDSIEDLYNTIFEKEVDARKNTLNLLNNQYGALDNNRSRDAMTENLQRQLAEQKAIQAAANKEAQRLRALGVDENDEAIQKCIDMWWDAYNDIQDINSKIADNVLSVYDDFIERADDFDLWNSFDFTRVDYLKRKLKEINRLYQEGILNLKDYNALLREVGVEIYKEQKDALEEIIERTMDLIRQETEDHIEALEDQISAFRKIIELKKESLKANYDEDNYQREVAKRVKEIAEKRAKLNQLERDDSREANIEKQKLAQELSDLETELADYQAQYGYDAQVDALDKQADAYEQSKNKEIDYLKSTLASEVDLYNAAIARIDSGWEQLYADLMAWNEQHGDMIDGPDSIITAWRTAKAAAEEYGSVLSALSGIKGSISDIEDQTINGAMTDQAMRTIISEMYSNSIAHHSADAAGKKYLSDRNLELGAALSQYGISAVRGDDGVWYLDKVGGAQLYDKYRKYTYHDGGVVGEDPKLKPNELTALLEKGERVVSKAQNARLLDLVKSGTDFISGMIGRLSSASPVVSDVEKSITNNDNTDSSITEGDITQENHFHLEGITEENMKSFAEYYSTYTINKLIQDNKRKGLKNSIGSHMLRG